MHPTGRCRSQLGISMVLIVILVVVSFILTTASILFFAKKAENERIQKALQAEFKRLDAWNAELENSLSKRVRPTGLPLEGKEPPIDKVQKLYGEKRKEILIGPENQAGHLTAIQLKVAGTSETDAAALEKARADAEAMAKKLPMHETLQRLVPVLAEELIFRRLELARLVVERNVWQERAQYAQTLSPEFKQKLVAFRADLQRRFQDLNNKISESASVYNTKKSEYEAERSKVEAQLLQEQTKFEQWRIRMKNDIGILQQNLNQLKVKQVIRHDLSLSHGKILQPDIPNRQAFIDLGTRERIVPGLKFLVARRGKQGAFEYKGEIEVKKPWVTYSEVSITKVFHTDIPILDGDAIVNPLYNPRRPVVVAFTGEDGETPDATTGVAKPLKLKFTTLTEAVNRIREMGAEVRSKVSLDVDYVIFTEAPVAESPEEKYEGYRLMKLLEIPMATAGRLEEDRNTPEDESAVPGLFEFLGD